MSNVMVRACHKCKVYVCIQPDDAGNLRVLNAFEGEHGRHMIQTVVNSEVQSYYREISCNPAPLPGNLLGTSKPGEVGRGHA